MTRRLLSTLRRDMVMQFRSGFYLVSIVIVVLWVAGLRLLNAGDSVDPTLLVPGIVIMNLMITTFYFVGSLVLLEKAESSLTGLAVTPLRDFEYLLAKALSLTLLAAVEQLVLVGLVFGLPAAWPLLVLGMLVAGGVYTLLGFVAIARYDSINGYLLPSVVYVTFLILPLADHFGLWRSPVFLLHPLQPALVLARAAYAPVDAASLVYAVAAGALWLVLSMVWSQRIYERFVIRAAGV